MKPNQTIRSLLERIQDAATGSYEMHPRLVQSIWEDAVAALELLDNARWITAYDQGTGNERGRLVPDSAPGDT